MLSTAFYPYLFRELFLILKEFYGFLFFSSFYLFFAETSTGRIKFVVDLFFNMVIDLAELLHFRTLI